MRTEFLISRSYLDHSDLIFNKFGLYNCFNFIIDFKINFKYVFYLKLQHDKNKINLPTKF